MKKKDLILIAAVLVAAALGWLAFGFSGGSGGSLEVRLEGKPYGTYPLSENRELVISTSLGTNTIVIKDGRVSFTDADCRDKYCERQGEISSAGESIVCLPHRLSAEIVADGGVDAVAR